MIELLIYAVGILLCFYMAWCMGANDAANPTECVVGSGLVSMKKAVILFALFAAIGGILLGPFVMKTVDRGIVSRENLIFIKTADGGVIGIENSSSELPGSMPEGKDVTVEIIAIGSFTAVLSAGIWITFSTWKGMPISTTHSIIGGVLGFGLIACASAIRWDRLNIVVLSLIFSPVLALLLAIGLFYLFRAYFKKTRRERSNLLLIYSLIYALGFATSFSILREILRFGFVETILGSLVLAFVVSTLTCYGFKKVYGNFESAGSLLYINLIALCFSALAFGANDMANATGVFVAPTEKLIGGMPSTNVMFLLAIIGAAGIAVGGLTWGYKVITTSAYQVTRLDPLSGAAAEYANAITVFLFTVVPAFLTGFGMPISTTHSSIGSIIGVGLVMRGLTGISKTTTSKILVFWILTIPCVALISMSLFWLFSRILVI